MMLPAIVWVQLLSGQKVPGLTADPVAQTTRELGEWSLRSLLVALAITPIARLSGWTPILTARRMVGLIAFTYVLVHWTFWMSLRSEEHTSELQSLMRISYAVFCLKKKLTDTYTLLK